MNDIRAGFRNFGRNFFYSYPKFILLTLISVTYLPFLNLRVLRMAGDEKVYISQAIEMARAGNWFVQTLAGVPNYFKGPLHYILLRIGMILFGENLFAATYMNWLGAMAIGLSLFYIGKKFNQRDERALLLGLAGALNVGVLSHAFASQMEVELCAFYAMGAAALLHNPSRPYFFWVLAGLAGWVKSPLHSVLLALGALSYLTFTNQIWALLKTKHFWFSGLLGVAVGVAGYLPAFCLDQKNFLEYFLGRENLGKPSNGRTWMYPTYSLPHFAWPWTLALLVSLVTCIKGIFEKRRELRNAFLFPLLFSLPTLLFFCTFPYKGQNYNLPTIPILLISIFILHRPFPRFFKFSFWPIGFLTLLFACLLSMILFYLEAWPEWWSVTWYLTAMASALGAGIFFVLGKDEIQIALGCTLTAITFLSWSAPLGLFELRDINAWLTRDEQTAVQTQREPHILHYYDLDQTIWSEWGIMELALHRPIYGLHRKEEIPAVFKPGHALLVPGEEAMQNLKTLAIGMGLEPVFSKAQITPWRRWRTKGKDASGKPLWFQAWQQRSLNALSKNYYILSW